MDLDKGFATESLMIILAPVLFGSLLIGLLMSWVYKRWFKRDERRRQPLTNQNTSMNRYPPAKASSTASPPDSKLFSSLFRKLTGTSTSTDDFSTINTDMVSAVGTTTLKTVVDTSTYALAIPGYLQINPKTDINLQKKLAEGGGGAIYLADIRDPDLRKRAHGDVLCAVKAVKEEEDALATFHQEVSIMTMLKQCPYVAEILGFADKPPTAVMKYYRFGSLADVIHADKNLAGITSDMFDALMISEFFKDIASGLAYIHDRGVVHSDIKPANILLDINKETMKFFCVICDFGVATIVNQRLMKVKAFQQSEIIGASLPYISPEHWVRISKPNYDPQLDLPEILKAGDVYSYGITLWEAMARDGPWKAIPDMERMRILVLDMNQRPQNDYLNSLIANLPIYKKMYSIVEACWGAKAVDRPTMMMVKKDIQAIVEEIKAQREETPKNRNTSGAVMSTNETPVLQRSGNRSEAMPKPEFSPHNRHIHTVATVRRSQSSVAQESQAHRSAANLRGETFGRSQNNLTVRKLREGEGKLNNSANNLNSPLRVNMEQAPKIAQAKRARGVTSGALQGSHGHLSKPNV